MSQKYIHCSWDILEPDSLVPRVPKTRIDGPNAKEDDRIPRICVSDTVERALKAMPGTGRIIDIMKNIRFLLSSMPIILNRIIKRSAVQEKRKYRMWN